MQLQQTVMMDRYLAISYTSLPIHTLSTHRFLELGSHTSRLVDNTDSNNGHGREYGRFGLAKFNCLAYTTVNELIRLLYHNFLFLHRCDR